MKMIDCSDSKFELKTPIASGSFGDVYKCNYEEEEEKGKSIVVAVAVKVIKGLCSDEKTRSMFVEECKIHSAMNHPNILPFIAASLTNDARMFIITKWIVGGSLYDRLYDIASKKEKKTLSNDIKMRM